MQPRIFSSVAQVIRKPLTIGARLLRQPEQELRPKVRILAPKTSDPLPTTPPNPDDCPEVADFCDLVADIVLSSFSAACPFMVDSPADTTGETTP